MISYFKRKRTILKIYKTNKTILKAIFATVFLLSLLFYSSMKIKSKMFIGIVDPFGFRSGEELAQIAEKIGLSPVIILSSEKMKEKLASSLSKNFRQWPIIIANDFEILTRQLAALNGRFAGFIPSSDLGIALADKLQTFFLLPSNEDLKPSKYRLEKDLMQFTLAEKGLASTKQMIFDAQTRINTEQFLKFFDASIRTPMQEKMHWIIKPIDSSLNDSVYVAENLDEVKNFVKLILSKKNVWEKENTRVLVQEQLKGTEYVIDAVSFSQDNQLATHFVIGAWKYRRESSTEKNRAPIISYVEWVPYNELPEKMWLYVQNTLDALGVKIGPSHLEIINTINGPVLVEVATKLPVGLPRLAAKTSGLHQGELSLLAYSQPEKLHTIAEDNNYTYPSHLHAEIIFLNKKNPDERVTMAEGGPYILKSLGLSTLEDFRLLLQSGDEVPITVDLITPVAIIHLIGKFENVEKDRLFLKKKHSEGFLYSNDKVL